VQSEISCVTVSGKYSRLRTCVNSITRIPSQASFPILQNSLRKFQESLFSCPPASGYLGSEFESRPMEVYSFYSRLVGWCLEQPGRWTTREMATGWGFCRDLPCRRLRKGTRFWWRHQMQAGFFLEPWISISFCTFLRILLQLGYTATTLILILSCLAHNLHSLQWNLSGCFLL